MVHVLHVHPTHSLTRTSMLLLITLENTPEYVFCVIIHCNKNGKMARYTTCAISTIKLPRVVKHWKCQGKDVLWQYVKVSAKQAPR